MIIASQKRKENIAEYLLYMWQIEDLLRANNLDIDLIRRNVIDRYELTDAQRRDMTGWYESLIDMMRREGVAAHGHLQLNKNTVIQLVDLHIALLRDPRFAQYTASFYKTLPYIVELRQKSGDAPAGEIETCFNALYGTLLLRLQGKQLSPDTQEAITQISQFIALLAHYFRLNEEKDLFAHEEQDATTETNS